MSIADWNFNAESVGGGPVPSMSGPRARRLHRIAEVRQRQGVSLRSAARRMRLDVSETRRLENEQTDMPLSMLYRWQQALDVPVGHLLADQEDSLSEPVLGRARFVRLMKTAAAIKEQAPTEAVGRLATMLIEQLCEIMPELKDVTPWHAVGQRRSLDECGRIVERAIPDDWYLNAGG